MPGGCGIGCDENCPCRTCKGDCEPVPKYSFAIDRGGTFTDIFCRCPNGKIRVMKLLSEDPEKYKDAPTEGIRRLIYLDRFPGYKVPKPEEGKLVDTSRIESIRMGTTVATNALLERKGERFALCITEGFKDLLFIGNQARPKIFDLKIEMPEVLYDEVVEIRERVVLHNPDCELNLHLDAPVQLGTTQEKLHVMKRIDEKQLKKDLKKVLDNGITCLAVVLMHSYTFAHHEKVIKDMAVKLGFTHVSLSREVMPMRKIVPRGYTACVDAYLTPKVKEYINSFVSGFDNGLQDVNVQFMQSDGGLTPLNLFTGSRALLSGPAGGVVGYSMTAYREGYPVIGFDMGGTSTDVSRYGGEYEHVMETTTAGVTVQAPQLDINTVAAGGGSKLFFRAGIFVVGPESAGANPGPACYRKGGPLTVTDANLVLGRLRPEYFPAIFGPDEASSPEEEELKRLDVKTSTRLFEELTAEVNEFQRAKWEAEQTDDDPEPYEELSITDVAMGFVQVADEAMCRAIRAITQAKGHDVRDHTLAVFGGAGAQHCCAIARLMRMKRVVIHKYAGLLSAYGMALADVVHEAQVPASCCYCPENMNWVDLQIKMLSCQGRTQLQEQGFHCSRIECQIFLNMRYDRTDGAIMCSAFGRQKRGISRYGDFLTTFQAKYKHEFGFLIEDRPVMIDDIRVRTIGKSEVAEEEMVEECLQVTKPEKYVDCHFWGTENGKSTQTPVYLLKKMSPPYKMRGPMMIIDENSTIIIEPKCTMRITPRGDIEVELDKPPDDELITVPLELDPIVLSIFQHKFMSIAEQMGRMLRRTAISTNIKERLDFSCALFGPQGDLVSNAPHIPVHLGAMQEAVKHQIDEFAGLWKDGDHVLSNHPAAGGSHLPDLTIVTPVFGQTRKTFHIPVFFLANRGHHADIGGITPGSMPPMSQYLWQEGAMFKSYKLVEQGMFNEEGVTTALMLPGHKPGCSGTRALKDNLADLRAQVAANQKGKELVRELMDRYSQEVVWAYMQYIQDNAETSVREMLREIANREGEEAEKLNLTPHEENPNYVFIKAMDRMDDGSFIRLRIDIHKKKGTAIFDFDGSSPQSIMNINAPKSITYSAVIYCLRVMIGFDMPLNHGCLAPIEIKIPQNSFLNPHEDAAVVGGNVLTSQRICDVILKAFQICAASQGCMNNVTFGDEDYVYYETIAGGAGAGPSWHGQSAVHTHMTNTRITDPEYLERRYPVILQRFHLNPGTGGDGEFVGGDGVVRQIEFRKKLTFCVLCERRSFHPYGLNGGKPGKNGFNELLRTAGPLLNLAGKCQVEVNPGDVFRMRTPGGGGWGPPPDRDEDEDPEDGVSPAKRRRVESEENRLPWPERGGLHEYNTLAHAH